MNRPLRMTRRTAPGTILVLAAVTGLAGTLPGCSMRTAGAPKGNLTLVAEFEDAQNLAVGHSVQIADVKVGSVTKVRLNGYRAEVTMSIKNDRRIPQGSSAEIRVTSLLGENYVHLLPPPGRDFGGGPYLASGARIAQTSVQPSFEQVVDKAGPLIDAIAASDVAGLVNAGATAFGGNGARLNTAVAKSSELLQIFGRQREELGRTIDSFARLGRSLAKESDEFERAPVELEKTTRMLNREKDRILHTLQQLTRTASLFSDKVLLGRVQRLKNMLIQLDPVLQRVVADRERLTRLVREMVSFEEKMPRTIHDGQILVYPILRLVLFDGTRIPPPEWQVPGHQGGAGKQPQRPGGKPEAEIPEELRRMFPDLAKLVGGRK